MVPKSVVTAVRTRAFDLNLATHILSPGLLNVVCLTQERRHGWIFFLIVKYKNT